MTVIRITSEYLAEIIQAVERRTARGVREALASEREAIARHTAGLVLATLRERDAERVLSVAEMAELLGRHPDTVRRNARKLGGYKPMEGERARWAFPWSRVRKLVGDCHPRCHPTDGPA
jgi:MoxR-like ATPase